MTSVGGGSSSGSIIVVVGKTLGMLENDVEEMLGLHMRKHTIGQNSLRKNIGTSVHPAALAAKPMHVAE